MARQRSGRDTAAVRRVRRTLAKQIKTKSYKPSPEFKQARQLRHKILQAELANPTGRVSDKEKAAQASWAAHGMADSRYEAAWSKYWYHNKERSSSESDENDEQDYRDDNEDEEGDE